MCYHYCIMWKPHIVPRDILDYSSYFFITPNKTHQLVFWVSETEYQMKNYVIKPVPKLIFLNLVSDSEYYTHEILHSTFKEWIANILSYLCRCINKTTLVCVL